MRHGRGDFASAKPPVLTLVRRPDGRVQFLVCKDLQDADEDIGEYGDGSVILCTDDHRIYCYLQPYGCKICVESRRADRAA